MKDKCADMLRQLTEKKFVLFVQRGNVAIRLALKLAKHLGYKKVLLQDQGGWITYKQFCKKEKLEFSDINTNYGIVGIKTLKDYSGCVLLINSMPAYAALQRMRELARIGMKQNTLIINDASGSIGTEEAKFGDVILGSFAIDKPVNISGRGGFMATDSREYFDFLEKNNLPFDIDFISLSERLLCLNERLSELKKIRNKLIKELEATEFANKIIHKDEKDYGSGVNLIVRYDSDSEKEKLIKLAKKEELGYTICPRDIMVKDKAICFEIKRK
jgi:hypothetical protein